MMPTSHSTKNKNSRHACLPSMVDNKFQDYRQKYVATNAQAANPSSITMMNSSDPLVLELSHIHTDRRYLPHQQGFGSISPGYKPESDICRCTIPKQISNASQVVTEKNTQTPRKRKEMDPSLINAASMLQPTKINPAKKRFIWTTYLHNLFVKVVLSLGDRAVPKKILKEMNVPGLTREIIASHLQKYRIALKNAEDKKKRQEAQAQVPQIPRIPQTFAVPPHMLATNPYVAVNNRPEVQQVMMPQHATAFNNFAVNTPPSVPLFLPPNFQPFIAPPMMNISPQCSTSSPSPIHTLFTDKDNLKGCPSPDIYLPPSKSFISMIETPFPFNTSDRDPDGELFINDVLNTEHFSVFPEEVSVHNGWH